MCISAVGLVIMGGHCNGESKVKPDLLMAALNQPVPIPILVNRADGI